MKLLFKGDSRVIKIVKKISLPADAEYRLSLFVHPFETEGRHFLRHSLTKQVFELDAEEWAALQAGAPSAEVRDELALNRFLVEKDYDEIAQYRMVLSTLRTMTKTSKGIVTYTVLPTTACNARCVYCYEEGIVPVTMTPEIVDATVDFICRTKAEGKIHIDWFGGEPLLGASIISSICRALKERGVEFDSGITTNATLLTPEIAQEAKDLWLLKKAQVSMDGARPDYAKRKNYIDPSRHNYDGAMRAVELLADAGVHVVLRCNYDSENLPRVDEFLNECHERFGGRENVSIYLAQLFQSGEDKSAGKLYLTAAEKTKALEEMGFSVPVGLERYMRSRYCMADSLGTSIIISPDGTLHRCEHYVDRDPVGTIFDEEPPSWTRSGETIADICLECPFLPDCTPFRRTSCPVKPEHCMEQKALETDRSLLALLKAEEKKEAEAASQTGSEADDEPVTEEATPRGDLC